MNTPLFHSSKGQYYHRLKRVLRSSMIAYWPLWEVSGSVANDISDNSINGSYSNVSLYNTKGRFGRYVPLFNAGNSYVNVTNIGASFDGQEGAIMFFCKPTPGLFQDGVNNFLCLIKVDNSNQVYISSDSSNVLKMVYVAGGVWTQYAPIINPSVWWHFCLSWSLSNSKEKWYINGVLVHEESTIGTFAGTLVTKYLGSAGGYWGWGGWMSDVVILNKVPTDDQVRQVAEPTVMTLIGDSITATMAYENYADGVRDQYSIKPLGYYNRASGGASIMSGMDAQVTASASDNADLIILALGTNDDNAGNMAALQAEVEENLAELKASNPNAVIYYLNVLPRWTNNTDGPEVDKSNIRAAIAAACTAQGVTCWDPYTTPWITQDQTADGVHPTAAGQAAIATQILSLLS